MLLRQEMGFEIPGLFAKGEGVLNKALSTKRDNAGELGVPSPLGRGLG